jgi:phosphopantothenoylcysteine synthetase/decarboxylase
MRVLITGGATRNKVDAIRYMSAHATGTTAVEIARLLPHEAEVDFLGSAEAVLRLRLAEHQHDLDLGMTEEFFGTRDLLTRMERVVPEVDVVIHSAAVGDYEWDATDAKIPSGLPEVTVKGRPAPKILDLVRGWNPGCVLVSFKACTPGTSDERMEEIALAQIARTGSDVVLANVIGAQDHVLLVGSGGTFYRGPRANALLVLVESVKFRYLSKKAAAG